MLGRRPDPYEYSRVIWLLWAHQWEDRVGISEWLREQVESHSRFFKLLLRPDMPVQVAFFLIRLCIIPSMGYLARVVSPRILDPHPEYERYEATTIHT